MIKIRDIETSILAHKLNMRVYTLKDKKFQGKIIDYDKFCDFWYIDQGESKSGRIDRIFVRTTEELNKLYLVTYE